MCKLGKLLDVYVGFFSQLPQSICRLTQNSSILEKIQNKNFLPQVHHQFKSQQMKCWKIYVTSGGGQNYKPNF